MAALVEREFLRRNLVDLAVAHLISAALESSAIAFYRHRHSAMLYTDIFKIGRNELRELMTIAS